MIWTASIGSSSGPQAFPFPIFVICFFTSSNEKHSTGPSVVGSLVVQGPCICRLFLFRYTNCQSKNGKRTLYPFFVFPSAIRKKENDYKQTILVFLIYERKRKTVQQTVFRFLCIRTENEMRLQRHSFSVFRFPFDATVPCINLFMC